MFYRTPGDTAATLEIKAIDSDQYMRWSMRFNAKIPEKPYHFFLEWFKMFDSIAILYNQQCFKPI